MNAILDDLVCDGCGDTLYAADAIMCGACGKPFCCDDVRPCDYCSYLYCTEDLSEGREGDLFCTRCSDDRAGWKPW